MKSALNSIMISSILAVGGIIALLFNLMGIKIDLELGRAITGISIFGHFNRFI